jgi:hypothetical protein
MEKNALNQVIELNKEESGISSLSIVGSIARGSSEYNDVDLLVTTSSSFSHEVLLRNIEESFRVNVTSCDDAYKFVVPGEREVSLAFKDEILFIRGIQEIIDGNVLERVNKVWAVGGFLPEILLGDVCAAKIIFDKSGRMTDVHNQLLSYPEPFAYALESYLREEILLKIKSLDNSDRIVAEAARSDVSIALIRLAFERERMFFPGLKHYSSHLPNLSPTNRQIIDILQKGDNLQLKLLIQEILHT